MLETDVTLGGEAEIGLSQKPYARGYACRLCAVEDLLAPDVVMPIVPNFLGTIRRRVRYSNPSDAKKRAMLLLGSDYRAASTGVRAADLSWSGVTGERDQAVTSCPSKRPRPITLSPSG